MGSCYSNGSIVSIASFMCDNIVSFVWADISAPTSDQEIRANGMKFHPRLSFSDS